MAIHTSKTHKVHKCKITNVKPFLKNHYICYGILQNHRVALGQGDVTTNIYFGKHL